MGGKAQLSEGSIKTYVRKFYADENGFDSESYEALLSEPFDRILLVLERLGFAVKPLLVTNNVESWKSWRNVGYDPPVDSFNLRLRWELAKLQYNSESLAAQLPLRDKVEDLLFKDDIDLASEQLEAFEARFGRSLWSLATRFRLYELEHGTDYNRSELMRFVESNGDEKASWWSNYLAHSFSTHCDSTLTNRDFRDAMKYLEANDDSIGNYSLNYLRYRLLSIFPTDDQSRTDVLHYESRHATIDAFDTVVTLLATADLCELPEDIAVALVETSKLIEYPLLSTIAFQVSPETNLSKDFPDVRGAHEAIFLGDFAKAQKLGNRSILNHPRYFSCYQITALSAAFMGDETSIVNVKSPIQRKILKSLFDWYSVKQDRKQALETLGKLSRFFSGTSFGWSLRLFIDSNDGNFDPLCSEIVPLQASPTSIPQHALHIRNPEQSRRHLDSPAFKASSIVQITSLQLLSCNHDNAKSFEKLDFPTEHRYLHLQAIAALQENKYAVACRYLAKLRQDFPSYYFSRPETQVLEASCLFETERFEEAARLTGTLYATNPDAMPPAQLRKFTNLINDENRDFDHGNICWAILAGALRSDEHSVISLDRVHDFVSDYIESQDCTLPTELLGVQMGDIDPVSFAFFRDCCRPEIMESSIWIESQQELFEERLSLCERIKDGIGAPLGIEGEIGSLMRKLAVIDITQRIERSKIFVDVEKICERSPDTLRDTIRRLLTIVAIQSDELKQGLKLLGMPDRDGGKVVVVHVDSGEELFRSIFSKLKEKYLFSPELGLDANLSQSIRHGPIISGIRAIFDKAHLVTRRAVDGEYAENEHWLSLLCEGGVERATVGAAFTQFAFEVDAFIRTIRTDEIQIRSGESPNGALFYEFSDSELASIFEKVEPFHDVDDVIGVILNALSVRTEACLQEVQKRVMNHWSDKLSYMLHTLRSQLEETVADQGKLLPFRTAVTDCSTEIPRGLEKIAAWFAQEDKLENKPFSVRDLVQSFELMARKSGQQCDANVINGNSGEQQMVDGAYFRPMWDLFFNLFDNALKHSGLDVVQIHVETDIEEDSTFVRVSNPLSNEIDIDELKLKTRQLNSLSLDRKSDLSKLRLEGGSGVAKLHKIVRHEIGDNLGDYKIHFDIDEQRHFVASVQFCIGVEA